MDLSVHTRTPPPPEYVTYTQQHPAQTHPPNTIVLTGQLAVFCRY